MAFGRRKQQGEPVAQAGADDSFVDDLDEEDRAQEDAELLAELAREEAATSGRGFVRPTGPWDIEDAPELDVPRLDLGALHVPVMAETEVRLEVGPDGDVVAATLVHGESALQLNAFAAPKTEGIWGEVRAEIKAALGEGGGQSEEAEGTYGTELRAQVPTEVPGQGTMLAPARFVGVDGPRWFLRGLLTGPAASDDVAAAPLLAAMKEVAVARGSDPMAVRDPLPLVLPADAMQAVEEQVQEAQEGGAGFQMPERGPEITEIR